MERSPRLPDRYRPVRPLGEGGSGRVWLVEDRQRPGRRIALKQWAAPVSLDRGLRHEFTTLTQLRHPNLVEVHELSATAADEAACFTLEFVDGEDIVTAIRREGPDLLPVMVAEGLRALAFLHDFGLVHRDLKPGNLLVRSRPRLDCRLVVLDFGLALRGETGDEPAVRTTAGTLPYLAPELFDGATPGARSDLYALGAVLFEAVHGRPPFRYEGGDLADFIENVRSGRRARPATPPGFAEGLASWLEELLSPDPAGRPAGAAEALARFNAACGTNFPSETPAGRAARLASGAPPGREREIAALWELLQPADRPRLVWLCGGPGSGKQRILHWLAGDALARGFDVRVGAPGRLASDPLAERDVDAFLKELRRAAASGPTLVLLREVETAGSRVATFLERVAREGRATPLRVVAALRPAEVRLPALRRVLAQSGKIATVARVDLPPLDTAALEKMVERAGGNRSPSRARLRWLADAAEGNLALAESLIVEAIRDGGKRVRQRVAADRSLASRLSSLPEDASRLLSTLSLLGEGAAESLLARLTALDEQRVRDAGAELSAVGLVCGCDGIWSVESRAMAGWVLETMDPEKRRAAFLRAARLLESEARGRGEVLARLWDGAGDRERAASAALEAAREANGEGDPVRAAQHLAFALLRLQRGDPRRGGWRLEQAAALRAANMPQAAARAYGAALRWNRDEARRGDILARQAAMLIQAGRFARGRHAAERALTLARSHGDAPAQARSKEAIGLAFGREGRGRDALSWFEQAVAEFAECGDLPAQAHALQSMALCEANEGLPDAREHFERARGLFEESGAAASGLMSLVGLAFLEQRAARLTRARTMLQEARRLAAQQHNLLLEGLATCTLAQTGLFEGRYAETIALCAESADQARFIGDDRLLLASVTARATALVRCGRPAEAAELIETALDAPHGKVDPVIVELARLALIEARLGGAPSAEEVGPLLQRSLDAARRLGDPDALLLALTLELDRRSRGIGGEAFEPVRREFDERVSQPGSWHQPYHIVVADLLQAAEQARREDFDAAARTAKKAARLAAELDLPGLEAHALGRLCDSLAREGQHEAAARAQEEGRERLERAAQRIEDPDLRRGFVERRVFAGLKRPVGFVSSVNRRLLALYDMIRALNSENNPDALLVSTLDMALEVVGAERGMILLRDPGSEEFSVRVARNLEKETIEDAQAFSHGIVAQAGSGRSVLAHDASSDERFRELKSVSLYGIHSLMCVPLRSRGAIIGTVYLDNRSMGRLFQPEDLRFLEAFADHASMALDNARTRERLIHENRKLQEAAERQVRFGNIVGNSPAMRKVFDLIEKVADSELPVLIQGETGTGKELVARAVHFNGARAKRIFVSENCAAIPDSLLQSELFGHVRGAFTGAETDRAGLFEQAHGGTLFLDEVGDMSTGMQAQLLRAIQEGEVRRVGADRPIHVDVRLIAATNRDLQREAAEGRFREDLMYRLQVLVIQLPPLRKRPEDIPLLIDYFLERTAAERGRKPAALDPRVRRLLTDHRWPGNVRQLEGTLQRLALLAGDGPIGRDLLEQDPALSRTLRPAAPAPPPSLSLGRSEREKIAQALGAADGNRTRAARLLGISRATIYRKIREYGLQER